MCSVESCEKRAVASGLCATHYKRMQRHGSVEQTRSKDWGTREAHPLYGSWTWMARTKTLGRVVEWDNFWVFVADVGLRPSGDHRVARLDKSRPFGPKNFEWQEMVVVSKLDAATKDFKADYARQYRKDNKDKLKCKDLQKNYGISLEEYNGMLMSQKGVCRICGNPEKDKHNSSENKRKLAVDHCHRSGKVRGLLCGACNKGLGYFKDNPESLQAAIKYLKDYQ
jgi:Recombination endonuclease VII